MLIFSNNYVSGVDVDTDDRAGRFTGVIHNLDKKEVRGEKGQDLIRFLDIKHFESLLAHQYTIRRLRLINSKEFEAIYAFRKRLCASLDKTCLTNEPRLLRGSKVTALSHCMDLLDSKENRSFGNAPEKIKIKLKNALEQEGGLGFTQSWNTFRTNR